MGIYIPGTGDTNKVSQGRVDHIIVVMLNGETLSRGDSTSIMEIYMKVTGKVKRTTKGMRDDKRTLERKMYHLMVRLNRTDEKNLQLDIGNRTVFIRNFTVENEEFLCQTFSVIL